MIHNMQFSSKGSIFQYRAGWVSTGFFLVDEIQISVDSIQDKRNREDQISRTESRLQSHRITVYNA